MARAVVLIVLAFMCCGCGSASSAPSSPLTLIRLRAEPYAFTWASGYTEPQRIVVRSQAQWQEVWSTIWRRHTPVPELPAIDFQREMVVVAAMGMRSTGGYNILIESASEDAGGVTVGIRATAPGAGCAVTLALTHPADVARLPRRDTPVSFSEKAETVNCQ